MPGIAATIRIDDEDASDLLFPMIEMVVEEDHRLAAMFRIKLAINQQDDGLWQFLDDEFIRPWAKTVISAIISDEEVELISGYITQIKPHFDPEPKNCTLEIYGLDASCLMSLEEKIRDWPNKTDSDIAREIFSTYNLTPEVEETEVVHDETITTMIQRETDIQFLKRLARRNGFECYVKGETAYFRKPVLSEEAQPVLAAYFGAETNLISFDAKIDAQRPLAVEMHQLDTVGKAVQDAVADGNAQRQLGRDGALSVVPPNGLTSKLIVRHAVAVDQPEMEHICRAVFDEAEWLIEARGEVDPISYGTVLQARQLAPIKGVGELFSGLYYLTNVRHVFTTDTYTQQFTARRNGLAPGDDDFTSSNDLF